MSSSDPIQTVLVIDDSRTVRLVASLALASAGFNVVEAVDGQDGLDKLAELGKVALVLCDVNMPRMSGMDFLANLATSAEPRPPVLMLTTEGHTALIQRAKACGARGWMMKPFRPESLVAAARKLIAA
ncbi:MAG: Chemotaxis regulator - transmits chemoreceptor signals to flagelllar motor component CheY [Labilithrix sp.]|nr:Chemotaxis regulator - transmits chemoreceptor signals to flagelllar motor component CheY [Labilithrix sp.]